MKILITGLSGFIGSHVETCLGGHEILAFTRSTTGANESSSVHWENINLDDREAVNRSVSRFAPDACLHLAWSGLPDYSPENTRRNVLSSLTLIDALHSSNTKKIVLAGSCWEYGNVRGLIRESQPVVAPTSFAIAKTAIFNNARRVFSGKEFVVVNARIFFSYGPGQRLTSLIPATYSALMKGQEPQVKTPNWCNDMVYVDDVATALARLTTEKCRTGIYNVGSGISVSVGSIVNRISKECGKSEMFLEHSGTDGYWADISKIQNEIGWKPRVKFTDGLARTIASLRVDEI